MGIFKPQKHLDLTKRPLFYWVLTRYRGAQFFLLLVIIASLFFKVYPLEMQKNIINIAINLKLIDKLYLYCSLYMGAVLIAGSMKYFINSFRAALGQKILIGMRKELYEHVLKLPLQFFHRTQPGTIISAMTSELNAIGTFLGDALAVPATSFLTFLVFAGFMINLNPLLGFLSIGIYPIELFLIPIMQRRYNKINQTRVTTTRAMANLINEASSGIHEVQSNASHRLEQNKLDRLIMRLYSIMKRLFILKYGIKFSNNLFQSFGPFLLFLIGGYMAIHGNFTIGALVAFLTAYEKVYDPWKEIIDYYQNYQDAQVRYSQIMTAFDIEPEYLLEAPKPSTLDLKGNIRAQNIKYIIGDDVKLLDQVSFSLDAGKHMALVGFSGSGKSTLSLLIAQLHNYTSGSLTIDGVEVKKLTKMDIARNISLVAQHPFIFTGTVRDNLLYSCTASVINGNEPEVPDQSKIIEVVRAVGIINDIIRWGFTSIIPKRKATQLEESFLKMRKLILGDLRDQYSRVVEFYDLNTYLEHVSLGTNIIFGYFSGELGKGKLINNALFRSFLKTVDLENDLIDLGISISSNTIDFLQDMHEDEFFFQGSPMEPDEFTMYAALGKKLNKVGIHKLKKAEKEAYLLLALRFVSADHKIYTLSDGFKEKIVALRKQFLAMTVPDEFPSITSDTVYKNLAEDINELNFTPFHLNKYLYNRSLSDNVLFGTVTDLEKLQSSVGPHGMEVFEKEGLAEEIISIGLDFYVGSKGDNLSGGQKQKIAIARALLRQPPILILDEATASLDNSSQTRIHQYISENLRGSTTVVAVVHRLDMISEYDHIVVMKGGKLVESGDYSTLIEEKGTLYELINN